VRHRLRRIDHAAREIALTEATVLPSPVSLPPDRAFKWAKGFTAALGEPLEVRTAIEIDKETCLVFSAIMHAVSAC
jgi:hypothetical protein